MEKAVTLSQSMSSSTGGAMYGSLKVALSLQASMMSCSEGPSKAVTFISDSGIPFPSTYALGSP